MGASSSTIPLLDYAFQEVTCRGRRFAPLMTCREWKAGPGLTRSTGRETELGFSLFLEFLIWLRILGKQHGGRFKCCNHRVCSGTPAAPSHHKSQSSPCPHGIYSWIWLLLFFFFSLSTCRSVLLTVLLGDSGRCSFSCREAAAAQRFGGGAHRPTVYPCLRGSHSLNVCTNSL